MNTYTNNLESEGTIIVSMLNDETLSYYLKEIYEILNQDGVTEVCINKPHEIWYEINNEWVYRQTPNYSAENLDVIFNHIGNLSKQIVTNENPILSAALETGERVQLLKPPVSEFHSLTIRKPSKLNLTLEQLHNYGAFDRIQELVIPTEEEANANPFLKQEERELLNYLYQKDYINFFRRAVKLKKNIIVAGATGSGKTTFTKSLIREINDNERIITIEDVPELDVKQPNHVSLRYSKDSNSTTKTTPKQLLESCLRMRPDRILLAELRGEEAFYYIRNVNSGHPGSITSIHAESASQTFDQLMLLIKESTAGNNLAREDIIHLLQILVDIVVQYHRQDDGKRVVTEIYYNPVLRKKLAGEVIGGKK